MVTSNLTVPKSYFKATFDSNASVERISLIERLSLDNLKESLNYVLKPRLFGESLAKAFHVQCHVNTNTPNWHVESGATDHMTPSCNSLHHSSLYPVHHSDQVFSSTKHHADLASLNIILSMLINIHYRKPCGFKTAAKVLNGWNANEWRSPSKEFFGISKVPSHLVSLSVGLTQTRSSGGNLVSWSAKKQPTVSRSSCESEYQAMANTATEINPVSHKRAKHIDLDYHFIRELVHSGKLYMKFVPTNLQVADIFTKSLPRSQFETFRTMLQLGPPPFQLKGDING
ncbi:hypothetical protein Tco_1409820 [Tanacetum coccineum]